MNNMRAHVDLSQSVEELLHLGFRRYPPHPALQEWVESYWTLSCTPESPQLEKLYPDGGSSLIFDFLQGRCHIYASHGLREQTIAGATDLLGVRFTPAGLFYLLKLSPLDINEHGVAATSADIPDFSLFCERMHSSTAAHRLLILDQFLLDQLTLQARPRATSALVLHYCRALSGTTLSVAELASAQGINRRRIERLFSEQVGLSPNEYRQLQRIKHARYLIKHYPDNKLSDVAQACGYFDQAHFIHQFMACTGCTPGEYRRRQQWRLAQRQMRVLSHSPGTLLKL